MSTYQNYIRPLLEQAKDRGASDLLLAPGLRPKIRTFSQQGVYHPVNGGHIDTLDTHPIVEASVLQGFLEEIGVELKRDHTFPEINGYLGRTIRLHAVKPSGDDSLTLAFRHLQEVPASANPENSGDLNDLIRSGKTQSDLPDS